MELTGTNGGKAITLSHQAFVFGVARIASFGLFPMIGSVRCVSRNDFASIVRFPDRHMPSSRWGGDLLKICGDHSQGETPGPIPNPEAKALHGDGTAPERVWESSTSPLTLLMALSPW